MKNPFFLPDKIPKYLFLLALLIGLLFSCKKTPKDCEDTPPDLIDDVAISIYLHYAATGEPILGLWGNQLYAYKVKVQNENLEPFERFDADGSASEVLIRPSLFDIDGFSFDATMNKRFYLTIPFHYQDENKEDDIDTIDIKYYIREYQYCNAYYKQARFDTLQVYYNGLLMSDFQAEKTIYPSIYIKK